jgi:hypothetical protein
MDSEQSLEYQWSYIMSMLPSEDVLERTARDLGALVRKRSVSKASDLLRLALVYGACSYSLRQTAAWAEMAGVASLSDVALLKRLRNADRWLGALLGLKLAERAAFQSSCALPFRLRLIDATMVSVPGSKGSDWRIHLGFDLATLAIDHIELTDHTGGETLKRTEWREGDVVVGDRGYAHRTGIAAVARSGADLVVRHNWSSVPLEQRDGGAFDLLSYVRSIPDACAAERSLQLKPSLKDDLPTVPIRLVVARKSEAAAEQARQQVLKERARKSRNVDPRTLEYAGYFMVLTTLPASSISAEDVLELYRFRWQIELAFKRMKSLMDLGHVPAKDPPLARCYIQAKLLAALLLDDLTQRYLAFSPWGFRLA